MHEMRRLSFEEVVELYTKSRFIYEQKRELLAPYWDEISSTWGKLLTADQKLFQMHYQLRDGLPSSSICRVLFCDQTWMVQHAVSLKDPSGLLTNMLNAVDWAASSKNCDHVRILYRPNNPWPRNVFGTIAPTLLENSSEYHVYDYYNGKFGKPVPLIMDQSLTVEYLQTGDFLSFSKNLSHIHSGLFVRSRGIHGPEFGMKNTARKYAHSGLERDRSILIARRGSTLLGYSLLEYSSLGINFSLLLNAFSIKMFVNDEVAEQNLIASSMNHYIQRGRNFVVALCEDSNRHLFATFGLHSAKQYEELIFSTGPNLALVIHHLKECYGHRNINPVHISAYQSQRAAVVS